MWPTLQDETLQSGGNRVQVLTEQHAQRLRDERLCHLLWPLTLKGGPQTGHRNLPQSKAGMGALATCANSLHVSLKK